jgi:hypothetical protein
MPTTNAELYRAVLNGTFKGDELVKDDKPIAGVLYPRFEETQYVDRQGIERTSPADVTVHPKTGGDEVDAGGGTSMFDVCGWFGFTSWKYFHVPEGTEYPDNLFIRRGKSVRTNKSGKLTGRHYQIEPRNRMTVQAYKGALDNFARNAVVQQIRVSKVN